MRTFVLLSIVGAVAAGSPSLEKQGSCIVDGGEAVSDLMDSAMFIWAAVARCEHDGEQIKCEVAVASALESVNAMINVILKAVDKCDGLHTANKKCGLTASKLSRGVAGLAAAGGGITEKCPGLFGGNATHGKKNWAHAAPVQCVVNLKSTAKSLFKAIKSFMKVKKGCEHGYSWDCTGNALKIVSALAGLGEYLSGALGHCTHTLSEADAGCAQHVSMLIHDLAKVADGGTELTKACDLKSEPIKAAAAAAGAALNNMGKLATAPVAPVAPLAQSDTVVEVQVPRLYEKEKHDADHGLFSTTNLALGAFLPVTAIAGYFGGRLYAANFRTRAPQSMLMPTPRASRELVSEHE